MAKENQWASSIESGGGLNDAEAEKTSKLAEQERMILKNIEDWVKSQPFPADHPWDHVRRVTENAAKICQAEGGDEFLVCLSALLHDLGRIIEAKSGEYRGRLVKTYGDHGILSLLEAHEILQKLYQKGELSIQQWRQIAKAIRKHNKLVPPEYLTRTIEIVQDADKLDTISLDGVLRTLIQARREKVPIWEQGLPLEYPEDRPLRPEESDVSFLGYVQFIYNWKNVLTTATAKELAKPGLALVNDFLDLLRQEISRGDPHDYDFWEAFLRRCHQKNRKRVTKEDLNEFAQQQKK